MKIYIRILIILSGVLTAQCDKGTLEEIFGIPPFGEENKEEEDGNDYNSFWYYSYEASQLINAQSLAMQAPEDFTPYTIAHSGDTLFIANTGVSRLT